MDNFLEKISSRTISDSIKDIDLTNNIKSVAQDKLEILQTLYNVIKKEVEQVILTAEESMRLHEIKLYGKKIPGKTYYLYNKKEETYFSLMSLEEYLMVYEKFDGEFLGEYLLDYNGQWKKISKNT